MEPDKRFQPGPLGSHQKKQGSPLCESWQKALLCIDLQYLGCAEGYGVFESHRKSGVSEDAIQYYLRRVRDTVVPNVSKLQEYFRANDHEVIHIHIQSLTEDGRDRSLEHKRLGLHAPPGSKLAEFLPEVAPVDDEIVLSKTASGVFIATNIESVLRNLCISELYIAGVYTNECISSAVRSASDLGFQVSLISDCTAAITKELHKATLLTLNERYAQVMSADELIRQLEAE
ncbi:cysteine hydrolase family protein [Lacimicrobium alkaliphilum]|uniref:N-carbamoylsarcosine amidase n=1 Tax=Lacimicrobium alkaliphilum TaxID=1526571 RepID=A0ABQ1RDI7_9ALTE|nr:isochorismatase family cysteine hydrolase [Lacimicrobium alkaliphilum]GGD63265.1 N-carbamoylsarcosine amidase [Lacimicrobium alkaliphilum]